MWWHKIMHRVTMLQMTSLDRPRLWLCSCGKQWNPSIRRGRGESAR